jgi:hypothetical protein
VDWRDSARFTSIFLALGFFCSQTFSQPARQPLTQTVGLPNIISFKPLCTMSKFYYDLYCDESGTDRNNFCFGAIHCSRARADILDKQVRDFRARTGFVHEMKWTKVSKTSLPAYTEFADIFLDDRYATFILSKISKGEHWRKLATSDDSRFLHAYFHFIEQAMWASARYAIFLDETTSKPYKFEPAYYCISPTEKSSHIQNCQFSQ